MRYHIYGEWLMFQVGAPIQSDELFFGRQDELRELLTLVEGYYAGRVKTHIALLGIRRVGKSSVLYKLQRDLPSLGFYPVYLNVEQMEKSPQVFFWNLTYTCVEGFIRTKGLLKLSSFKERLREAWTSGKESFKGFLEKLNIKLSFGEMVDVLFKLDKGEEDWRKLGKSFFQTLNRLTSDVKYVFLIDEFGEIIKFPQCEEFLHFLRGCFSTSRACFILTGSQNVMRMVKEKPDYWTNILYDFKLKFFEIDIVTELMKSRFEEEGFTIQNLAVISKFLHEKTKGHPIHLQAIGAIAERQLRRDKRYEVTLTDARKAYESYIKGELYEKQGLGYYKERLDTVKRNIVKQLAIHGELTGKEIANFSALAEETVLDNLDDLVYDFYVERNNNHFLLVDSTFQEWFKYKYVIRE